MLFAHATRKAQDHTSGKHTMTLREQLQEAADAGYRLRPQYEEQCAQQRRLDEERRIAQEQAITANAKERLKSLPGNVREAAMKGEATCYAAFILVADIEGWQEFQRGRPFDTKALRGVSLRIFELLEADRLSPAVIMTDQGQFLIQIPVPPNSAASPS